MTDRHPTVWHISRGFNEEEQEKIGETLHNLFVKPEPPELIRAFRIASDHPPTPDLLVSIDIDAYRTEAKPLAKDTWIALVQDTTDAERVCAAFITATEEAV